MKNCRPICLINTDYRKILFIFARHLQKVIDDYMVIEQTTYTCIKGMFIGTNARLMLDMFEYCENNNQEGLQLFLHFTKALHSVEGGLNLSRGDHN